MYEEYTMEDRKINTKYVFSFLLILTVFILILSAMVFSGQSLRLDESQSLWQSSHSPVKILSIIAKDVHVPFYAMLLHFWQFIFGNGVVAARILSLIFALASIPAIYFLGKISYNKYVGLVAALLLSISPFFNWYGNEIRMYSLLVFLTILNQYFFIRIFKSAQLKSPARVWAGYGITALLGIFTHYFFGFMLLTQALFFLVYKKNFSKDSFKKFSLIALGLVVTFLPWVYFVMNSGGPTNSIPLLYKPTSINLFNTFSQFLFGFQNDQVNTLLVSLWPLSVLLVFLGLRRSNRINPETGYFILSVLLPVIIAFAVSATFKPIFVTRYLILTLPSLFIILSWLFRTYPPRLRMAVTTIVIVVMLATLSSEALSKTTPVKENYAGVAAYLKEHARPQDVVVVSAPFTIYPIEYYYHGPAAIETLPLWNRYASGPVPAFSKENLPEEVATIKGNHEVLWLILSYDQGYAEDIRLYMDTNFERLDMKEFSPDLKLYVYKLRYDAEYLRTDGASRVINDLQERQLDKKGSVEIRETNKTTVPKPTQKTSATTTKATTTPVISNKATTTEATTTEQTL